MKKWFRSLKSLGLMTSALMVAFTPLYAGDGLPQNNDPWFEAGQERIRWAQKNSPIIRPAKNIILFVGDGMGVSTQTAARILQGQQRGEAGEENLLSFEKFPYSALSKTYNTNQQVSDSAGTAVAMMAGIKTKAGVLGVDSRALKNDCASSLGTEVTSALELAEMAGMSTGVISTARLTHATPAATYAHTPARGWEDDKDLTDEAIKNGCKDIASQLLSFPYGNGIEVAMGGGRRSFIPNTMQDPEDQGKVGERKDGRNLTSEWTAQYKNSAYVWNQSQFDQVDPDKTDHLLALFNGSHMEYEVNRSSDKGGEPSLSEMTKKSIQILSKNKTGYFLMVESGRIDHGHHDGSAYRALNDTVEFSNAVKAATEMTDMQETLIIVTADHSHTMTIVGYPTRGNDILGKVIGNDSNGLAKENLTLADDDKPYTTIAYSNGEGAWQDGGKRPDVTNVDTTAPSYIQQATVLRGSESHGGEDVAILAQGPMAHLFGGVVEQNYIFHVMNTAGNLVYRAKVMEKLQKQAVMKKK